MARIKVLQVITLSELGGAQKVVYHIAAGLDPQQFDLTIACAPNGELVNWLRNLPHGVQVVEIFNLKRSISPLYDLKAFLKLYSLMKKDTFDIVHCHSSKAGVLGRLAARLAGAQKIFFTVHGWGINEYQNWPVRFFYTWMERLAGALSTKVICVSESDLLKGQSLKLVAEDKLSVIYNGLPEPVKREGFLRKELNIGEKDIVIGTVARLASQKDPLFLLEVAERMINRPGNAPNEGQLYFVIIGDGPLKSECENFINGKGLKGRVFLLGAREGAAELVRDFDIFVLFSRWEGLPLTIIEAMMAEVPVVANDVGGVGELVMDGETGFLVKGLDIAAAERALARLQADGGLRRRLGQAGRLRARQKFLLGEMLRRYRELYLS